MMSWSMVFDGIGSDRRRKQEHEGRSKDLPLQIQHLDGCSDEFTNVNFDAGAQSLASGLQK
jgi:hypothetical protein